MASSNLPDVPDTLFEAFAPASDADWIAQIEDDLRGRDPESILVWDSIDGIEPRAYYRASDRADLPHRRATPLAEAADAPANAWRLRQDIAHPDLESAHRQVQDALEGGATDLGLVLRPSNDEPGGVPVHDVDALAALLEEVPLSEIPIHLAGGLAAMPVWMMLHTLVRRHNRPAGSLSGSVDYDPIAALTHHRMGDPDRAFALAAELARRAAATPHARLLTVDARPYHEAGASAVQELGAALGTLSELLVQLQAHDVPPADAAATLQWIVPVDTSYFIAIAKLRALRLLIPQVFAPFGVDLPPTAPFIQAVTARRSETQTGVHVNMLRATTEAAAAVLGGCDVLTVRPFTAAQSPAPGDFAQRMARNTQLILREESHLDHVADPSAGSYYIETMTNQLAQAAWGVFQDIERRGGLLAALQAGWLQDAIAAVRTERLERVATRQDVLVGTNHYPNPDEAPSRPADTSTDRAPRPRSDVELPTRPAALVEALPGAFGNGATLGDALAALRGDEAPTLDALPAVRLSHAFEALRRRTADWAATHGGPPRVTLLPMGNPAVRSARATFARNVFGVAGFAIDEHLQFDTPAAAAQAVQDAEADIAVLCSADDAYPDLAPALAEALHATGSEALLVVVAAPDEPLDALTAAGVDGFIHAGAPLLETLNNYQQRLGIG